jgi:hypothetical protein
MRTIAYSVVGYLVTEVRRISAVVAVISSCRLFSSVLSRGHWSCLVDWLGSAARLIFVTEAARWSISSSPQLNPDGPWTPICWLLGTRSEDPWMSICWSDGYSKLDRKTKRPSNLRVGQTKHSCIPVFALGTRSIADSPLPSCDGDGGALITTMGRGPLALEGAEIQHPVV